MNKPLLIILLLLLVGLLVYKLGFQSKQTDGDNGSVPDLKDIVEQDPLFWRTPPQGVKTDETPEFDVQLETRHQGQQQRLHFTVTEVHGWWVTEVYLEANYGKANPETGEFEVLSKLPVKFLFPDVIEFGKPLEGDTALTGPELNFLGGEIGDPSNWDAKIVRWREVYKPQ